MTWRLAQSLVVLRDQIDAMYPNRDKRTDGVISGYPGAISGHNVNAAGVVCAMDITTGDYPGGISMAESYPLADAIREELLVAPRGLYTYIIHHMEPPYVPSPGPYIAHGGPASLWQWIPYAGTDPHTSHIHVSVDEDIPTGGTGSGEDPYDMTDPWNLGGVTAQSGTITPIIQDWTDMATQAEVQAACEAAMANQLANMKWVTGGRSLFDAGTQTLNSLDTISAKIDAAVKNGIPLGLLTAQFRKKDGTIISVAAALGELLAQPGTTPASVDVKTLAAELLPLLPAGPTDLIAELRDQFNK